jgi:hypothetical protein
MKLRFDKSKRKYKNNRIIYEYERISLVIPKKYHNLMKLFQGKQLSINVVKNGENLNITLSEDKQSF